MKVRDFASKIGMASCEMPVEIKKGMDVIEKITVITAEQHRKSKT